MVRAFLLTPVVLMVAAGWLLPAMQDEEVVHLHTDSRVVEVDVSVRDAHGNAVDGLTKDDFTISDNGKPRAFTIFNANSGQATVTPAETPALPPRPVLPPHTFTNGGEPPPSKKEDHSTIILLDAINGWFDNFVRARMGVAGMLDKIPADEKIALYVISKGEGLVVLQDYTTDRARLLDVMTKYLPRGTCGAPPEMEPAGSGLKEDMQRGGARDGPPDVQGAEAARLAAVTVLDSPCRGGDAMERGVESVRLSLKALAERLGAEPGRKSVFWMNEGFPPRVLRGMNKMAWDHTISQLNDANIAVNAVDSNQLGGPPRLWGPGGILSMLQIADATGGKAYYNRNDLDNALAEGINASRSSYTLGFYLTDVDDKYHELKVRVNRPGTELRYRQGYYAQDESKRDASQKKSELSATLLNPADLAAVRMTANVETVPGKPHGTLNLRLNLDSKSLSLQQNNGGWAGKVDEMFVELNAEGRQVGRVSATKQFAVKQGNREKIEKQGINLTQGFQLADGAVKLSIIVRDSASGRIGSLTVPIDTFR